MATLDQAQPPKNGNGKKPAAAPPATTQAPKRHEGNGADPALLKISINQLGEALWPGMWEARKGPIAESCRVGKEVDMDAVYKVLKGRSEEIADLGKLEAHIQKSWPGWEFAPAMVTGALGSDKWSRLELLKGLAKAVSAKQAKPEMTDEQAVTIILAELSEASIPAEFR